ncbi:MAG TPA: hypothetical protein IAB42_00180 [Candidatus Coproplasma avistercoris]|nr:hypothetical protein [Candidatus Coproplasma avistercoris]
MTVTFCGHRDFRKTSASEKLLSELLEGYAQRNERLVCYNGGSGNFDLFAAECVKNLQKRFTNIRNCLVIPYIYPEFLERINILNEYFNETFYPPLERVPLKYAIIRRNEWMIDNADVLFACVRRSWGGAAQTLEYARQRKKIIEYLP